MAYTFTPEQDAAFAEVLDTTEYAETSPTDDTDPDHNLAALADMLAGVSPWDPGFEVAVDAALEAVKEALAGDPRNEVYKDARESLEALLLVNWGLPPEEITASAAGQHWKDELRIPKGNGDKSGQWTFTPWKWLDTIQEALPGIINGMHWDQHEDFNTKVRSKITVATMILDSLDKESPDPNDPVTMQASQTAADLFIQAAIGAKQMALDDKVFEDAAKGTLAFANYDWTLFDEHTDIGMNDPADDFGELLTDEETDIGYGDVIASTHYGPIKKAKDLKPGDTIVVEGEDGPAAIEVETAHLMHDPYSGDEFIEITDTDGATIQYAPLDDIETVDDDAEDGGAAAAAADAAALDEDLGPQKTAKDLKPGDHYLVDGSDGEPAYVQVTSTEVDDTGYIVIEDVEGMHNVLGPNEMVTWLPGEDDEDTKPEPPYDPTSEYAHLTDAELEQKYQHYLNQPSSDQVAAGIAKAAKAHIDYRKALKEWEAAHGGEDSAQTPLADWEQELLGMMEDDAPPVGSKQAIDIVVGDTINLHGLDIKVVAADTHTDPWGSGTTYVSVISSGGQEYTFLPSDHVTLAETAPAVDTTPAAPAVRDDFLGFKPLAADEKAAIKSYGQPSGYKVINPYLNNNGQVYDSSIPGLRPAKPSEKAFAEQAIKSIDSAFEKATPLSQPVTVVRLSGDEQFPSAAMKPGDVFENKSFVSTALPGGKKNGYGYEGKKVSWEITLPAGTKALQGNAHESEILLPRGSKFEVESDTMDENGIRNLKVRLVLKDVEPAATNQEPTVSEGYESPAAVPVGESVQLLPVWSGGSPVEYTKVADNEWSSTDPHDGQTVTNSDADLAEAWDTLFVQEENGPAPEKVAVKMPITGNQILPGDVLDLDGVVLKKAGGKLVPSTGVAPTVAEVKVGPKWANIVTTTGQKLWVPSGDTLTVKREVEPSVKPVKATSLLPGDTLKLDGPVLKKSAGKLIPAEAGKQGKHDADPVIADVKSGPKWTEVTTTTGQKLWISSQDEVTAERTPGAGVPGATVNGKAGSWKGKPAPQPPQEPTAPAPGKPKPGAFDAWLVAAKERYANSPAKVKGKLEDSNNWSLFQQAMGSDTEVAKTAIEKLHAMQYLDDAMRADALQIHADAAVVKPGEYEKYAKDHAVWAEQMAYHKELLAAWQKDNPTALKGMSGGKVFGSNSEGVAWANATLPKVTGKARTMVASMKNGSGHINGKLWNNGGTVPDSIKQEVADLDSGMSLLPTDIYLFRGTNLNEFKGVHSVEDLKKSVGTTFVQHGYQPTGLGVDTAFSGSSVQIVYRAPAGTKGLWALPVSPPAFTEEREYMLARNTRYFIHKVTEKNGKVFVEAEIIPEGQPDPTGQVGSPLGHKVGTHFARMQPTA